MSKIKNIFTLKLLDNRGMPAIQVCVVLENGVESNATISLQYSDESTVLKDIRTDQPQTQFDKAQQTIDLINNMITPRLIGLEVTNQQLIDKTLIDLDGTLEKSKIESNIMIIVSVAIARTAAKSQGVDLFKHLQTIIQKTDVPVKMPIPIFTMLDGGKHANFIIDIEDFLVVPASFKSYQESLQLGVGLHKALKTILVNENLLPFTGDRGGYVPSLATNEDGFTLLSHAIESISLRLGYDIYMGMDMNANRIYKDKHYMIKDRSIPQTVSEMVQLYQDLCKKYHILYLEDPHGNEDVEGWGSLYQAMSQQAIIAGDNYTSTNPYKLQTALEKKTINGIVIKPSQIGTLTEALAVAEMARIAGIKLVVADRTADTNDAYLADFSIAINADYVRFGAPVRGERVSKYNRLLEIERVISEVKQ